jgi:glycosyltransferase involved in cell wall biosynthesis
MKKKALVYSKKDSFWKSCVTITENILSTYKMAFHSQDLIEIDLNDEMEPKQIYEQAKDLFSKGPDQIVFVDHHPHPWEFIKHLDRLYQGKIPPIYFHLYGDFVCLSNYYYKIKDILERTPTTFFVASSKHARLINKFLETKNNTLIHPFPVNEQLFFYDAKMREEARKEYNLLSTDKVFLYTGRITYQKNVISFLKSFVKYLHFNPHAKFLLAGNFHDMGIPYIGKYQETGTTFYSWEQALYFLPREFKDRVSYIGDLTQEELQRIYCASDVFVSLSTFNDEDFGMSPAEALCCGLPSILTDWGGYSDYCNISDQYTSRVKVEMGHDEISFDKNELMKILLKDSFSFVRKDISRSYLDIYSRESVSKNLIKCFDHIPATPRFNEQKFRSISEAFENHFDSPFKAKGGGFNQSYFELYSSYAN